MLLLTIVLGCFAAKRQKQKTKRPGQTYLPTYLPTNQPMFVAAVNAFIPRCRGEWAPKQAKPFGFHSKPVQ